MAIPKVEWRPSPNFNQRDRRYPLRGDVSHRIVGSAASAINMFAKAASKVSSHFVIGHTQVGAPCPQCGSITGARGPLVIYQAVDLSNMAWTNGDANGPTWPGYQAGVNPNLTTVTTEHEDMATPGRHIVTPHIWNASMELKKLLRSGDLEAIRAAGVRIGNGAFSATELVAQMGAFPLNDTGYTDHHAIAGIRKPHCWRDYDGDVGFPRRLPALIAYLAAKEEEMTWQNDIKYIPPERVVLRAVTSYRRSPDLTPASDPVVLGAESTRVMIGTVKGVDFGAGPDWGVMVSANGGLKVFHTQDIVSRVPLGDVAALQAEVTSLKTTVTNQTATIATQAETIASQKTQISAKSAALANGAVSAQSLANSLNSAK